MNKLSDSEFARHKNLAKGQPGLRRVLVECEDLGALIHEIETLRIGAPIGCQKIAAEELPRRKKFNQNLREENADLRAQANTATQKLREGAELYEEWLCEGGYSTSDELRILKKANIRLRSDSESYFGEVTALRKEVERLSKVRDNLIAANDAAREGRYSLAGEIGHLNRINNNLLKEVEMYEADAEAAEARLEAVGRALHDPARDLAAKARQAPKHY